MKKYTYILGALLVFASCNNTSNTSEENASEEKDTIAQEAPVEKPQGYAIGDEAADFSLPSTTGSTVSLSNYPDAKGYIVTFTCNHCPYAVAYEQRIIDLNTKYAPLGYPVIAISPNDPEIVPADGLDSMKLLAEKHVYSFPYLLDEKQEIYPQYGATKTPHVFVLNKEEGKNIVRYIGAIDNNYEDANDVSEKYVEAAVDALIAGEKVAIESTKAIGCSIKDKRNKK